MFYHKKFGSVAEKPYICGVQMQLRFVFTATYLSFVCCFAEQQCKDR